MVYDNSDLKVYAYQEGEKECKHADNYVFWSAIFQQKNEKKSVLLAKHNDTNIPTMMETFSSSAAWFWLTSVPHPREPTRKGLDEAIVEGFIIKL